MKIAPPPISSKFTHFLETRKYAKEQKFLNKFCNISNNIEGDTFNQLQTARKTIANYAKSKGVIVEIGDAEKKVAKEKFEFDIDERHAKRAANGNLSITVKPLKQKGNTVLFTTYASKDTKKTHLHTVKDYFVVDYPEDGLQQTRLTKHENEDNFIRNVFRKIENAVKSLEKDRANNKK